MKKLVIVGASGHGMVIADIALKIGYKDIVFLDDDPHKKECAGYPVIGRTDLVTEMEGDKIVAIGNVDVRKRIQNEIETVTLIHPSAVISRRVKIGAGTVVMAGAVINSDVTIGQGCIINTCASVDHECVIGDYAHISVGAHVAGNVSIGQDAWIGAGATISNNINICNGTIIGAGGVVIDDIVNAGTYIGVPAKKI